MTINSFSGEYAFLSNFYYCPLTYGGIEYPTSEHAFQAAKTLDIAAKHRIAGLRHPTEAKRAGRMVTLRNDWEDVKDGIMFEILCAKFSNRDLAEKLVATFDHPLVEGNTWNDTYWGVCNGLGLNRLGNLLMLVRSLVHLELSGS